MVQQRQRFKSKAQERRFQRSHRKIIFGLIGIAREVYDCHTDAAQAELFGCCPATVARWRAGEFRYLHTDTLFKAAEAVGAIESGLFQFNCETGEAKLEVPTG